MYRIWNIYSKSYFRPAEVVSPFSMLMFFPCQVLAAFGTIGGALFGFDISSMSAWIGSKQYLDYFHNPGSTLQGGITASMSAGSFVGAISAGFISDHYGRKGALWTASVIWIIGAALQASSQNVGHLIAGRVVSGLASKSDSLYVPSMLNILTTLPLFPVGITSSQVCVFLAELAPSRIRGRIVGIQQWAIEWGIFIMYLISYGCSVGVEGPAAFRIAWGIQGILGIVLGAALFFFPESPRWLASKGRWDECLYVLANLHAKGDERDPVVLAELEEGKCQYPPIGGLISPNITSC
jgi:MFS family permease